MITTVSLILLFILKCFHRINKSKSIITTIHEKYGRNMMKCVRQYERMKIKHCRLEQNTEFLRICLIYNVLPKFIRFKPYNTKIKHTHKYQYVGRSMLYDLFKEQEKGLKKILLNITDYKLRIKSIVNYSTWIEIESYINKVIKNEKLKIKTRHDKKYRSLKIPVNQDEFNNNKLVYNLSYRTLSEAEESLLAKGWKYAIKINRCNVLNVKAEFEYMYYIMEKNLL